MPKAAAEEHQIAGHTVRLSSPDKVIFPGRGFTKRDVFEYYLAVGDGILRALRDRPTTLQRFPDGIEGEAFYQKRIPTRGVPDWIRTATIKFPSMRTADELSPADLARECGVTPRALQYAFRAHLGCTPQDYLRRIRLDLARRSMRDGTAASVSDAAAAFGFFNPGRFASDYRQVFNENPGETMERSNN